MGPLSPARDRESLSGHGVAASPRTSVAGGDAMEMTQVIDYYNG